MHDCSLHLTHPSFPPHASNSFSLIHKLGTVLYPHHDSTRKANTKGVGNPLLRTAHSLLSNRETPRSFFCVSSKAVQDRTEIASFVICLVERKYKGFVMTEGCSGGRRRIVVNRIVLLVDSKENTPQYPVSTTSTIFFALTTHSSDYRALMRLRTEIQLRLPSNDASECDSESEGEK